MATFENLTPQPVAEKQPSTVHDNLVRAAWTPPTEGGGGTPGGGTKPPGTEGGGGGSTDNTNTNTNTNTNRNFNRDSSVSQSTSSGSPVNIKTEVAPNVGVASYALPNCGTADGIGISTIFGGGSLSHTRISDKCLASNEWLAALDMANRGVVNDANVGLSALNLLDTEQRTHTLPNDAYGQARARIEGAFAVQSLSNSLGSQELALSAAAAKLGYQVPLNQLGGLPDATIGTGPQAEAQVAAPVAINVIAAAYANSGERGVAHVGHHTVTKAQAAQHGCEVAPDGTMTFKGQKLHVDAKDNLVTADGKIVYHLDKSNSQ